MRAMTRREFLERAAVVSGAAGFAAAVVDLRANPLGLPIGSQVYPLRSMLKDLPAFVKMLAEIGVTRLELCSPIGYGAEFAALSDGKAVKTILADHGMKSESSHFTLRELRTTQEKSIAWASEVGITQMVTATLADGNGGSNPTIDQVKRAAEEYNAIAAVAAKAGMQQGLHNEGFETSSVDGQRTYDLLLEWLDPKLVKFQFQMSTITAGLVAAEYFLEIPWAIQLDAPPGCGHERARSTTRRGRAGRPPPAGRDGQGLDRLGPDLRRREDRRRAELLRGAELGADAAKRGVSQDAEGLTGGVGSRQ